MQEFIELGTMIETRWREQNYNDDVFPDIAANALGEADLVSRIDPWDPVRWVHTTTVFPQQQDPHANFGDPPITLYVGPHFYIDLYYWLDSTTAVHEHGFSGAFQVLLGGSVHGEYAFKKVREINPHFWVGDVLPRDASLLSKGDVREIICGSSFIHSLFHLDRPSASIVVRSKSYPKVQFRYLEPYLAIDPFHFEPWIARRIQTVSLLLASNHGEADRLIVELLETSDFLTTFLILQTAFDFLGSNKLESLFGVSRSADRFDAMVDRARRRHGSLADLLPHVFSEALRKKDIKRRRQMIKTPEHRLFLGLLLNVTEREKLLKLIGQRFPENSAAHLIVKWVKELSLIKNFGSPEPNVLGIKGVDDTCLNVLSGLLEGASDTEVRAGASKKYSGSSIDEAVVNIRESNLFKAIFSEKNVSANNILAP